MYTRVSYEFDRLYSLGIVLYLPTLQILCNDFWRDNLGISTILKYLSKTDLTEKNDRSPLCSASSPSRCMLSSCVRGIYLAEACFFNQAGRDSIAPSGSVEDDKYSDR